MLQKLIKNILLYDIKEILFVSFIKGSPIVKALTCMKFYLYKQTLYVGTNINTYSSNTYDNITCATLYSPRMRRLNYQP